MLGIDLAGPERENVELRIKDVGKYEKLFAKARAAGLKTTVHTGETKHTSVKGVIATIKRLKPDRIGHGIHAAKDKEALKLLSDNGIVLEICPTSNLYTRAVKDLKELGQILQKFKEAKVQFTINTDGPYLLKTHLCHEATMLLDAKILTPKDIRQCFKTAKEASFIQ